MFALFALHLQMIIGANATLTIPARTECAPGNAPTGLFGANQGANGSADTSLVLTTPVALTRMTITTCGGSATW